MSYAIYEAVRRNPKFEELVRKRSRFAWILSFIMLGVYYAFILVLAFFPEIFARKIGEGVTTLGIPVGICVILIAFVLTGIYTQRANGEFDELTQQIKDEARGEA